MSYCWFNKQELLKKQKKNMMVHMFLYNGSKEKAAKYYRDNEDVLKEKARNKYKNLTEAEKELKRQHSRDRYSKLKENWDKL